MEKYKNIGLTNMENIIGVLNNSMKIMKTTASVVIYNDIRSQMFVAQRNIEYVLKKLVMTDNLFQYDVFVDLNKLSKEDKIFLE